MIKCKGCSAEIPPQWVAAINSGICPGCGGEIFHSEEKELLCELREAMKQMESANPESITGWLLSNYTLQKIGTAEPIKFHQRKAPEAFEDSNGSVLPNNIKIADNPVHAFLQRTGYGKDLKNRKRLKDIVNEIEDGGPGIYDKDYDPDIELSGPAESSAKEALSNNVAMGPESAPTREELVALANAVSMAGQTTPLDGDLPPALQIDRMKRLKQQQGVASGGGGGSFRRSG